MFCICWLMRVVYTIQNGKNGLKIVIYGLAMCGCKVYFCIMWLCPIFLETNEHFLEFLLVVTTEKPVQACLYQVKKTEKEKGEVFKKKASWPLRQLKVFDAKYSKKVPVLYSYFYLHFYNEIIHTFSLLTWGLCEQFLYVPSVSWHPESAHFDRGVEWWDGLFIPVIS